LEVADMTSRTLDFEDLIAIAPEVTLAGEIDNAKLLAIMNTLEGHLYKRNGGIKAIMAELDRLDKLADQTAETMNAKMSLNLKLSALMAGEPRALLTLMTYGSHPDACLGVYDLIHPLEAAGTTVYVRVQGMCYGAATVILAAVDPSRRYASANTMFSLDIGFHQPGFHVPSWPKPSTPAGRVLELLYQGTGLSRQDILTMPPTPFGADKALEYGLIDHIIGVGEAPPPDIDLEAGALL